MTDAPQFAGIPTFDGYSTFGELVRAVHEDLSGRAAIDEIGVAVRARITVDQFAEIAAPGFHSRIRTELNHDTDEGLPHALEVGGQYVQLVLFSVDEYREAVRKYMSRARANRLMAERLVDQCKAIHGIVISLSDDEAVGQ